MTDSNRLDMNSWLSSIVESSEDPIFSKTLDGTIQSWNMAATLMFGYTADEIIGKNISVIIPDELEAEEKRIIERIEHGDRILHYETIRLKKDGIKLAVVLNISPIRDKFTRIVGASVIARDQLIQVESEKKKAMLAAIIDSSVDAIISKTLNGIITSWNYGAETILGYTEKEAIGQHITMLIPEDRKQEEEEIISRIRRGERVDHFETIRKRKDGTLIHASITVSPIVLNGKIIGASKILRDISDRIEYKSQLQEQTKKLEELNQSKDQFIGIASHELKTPLTSIKAYLQLLERTVTDSKHKLYVSKTLLFVGKLEELVSDLLDVSKIQAGKLQLNIRECSIREIVENAVESVQHTTSTHQILITGSDEDLRIKADQNRVEQVIINFLTNAIKYSPLSDRVEVSYWRAELNVLVKVRDFGIGIPEENTEKIFQRFYRVESTSPHISGLGIGLFISCQIIKRHHGEIWVESVPGKGSEFYFSLPLK